MAMSVNSIIFGVMRFLVGVRVIVEIFTVPMSVGVDDDLTGRVAVAAVLSADFARSPAFGAFPGLVGRKFLFHNTLLSVTCDDEHFSRTQFNNKHLIRIEP